MAQRVEPVVWRQARWIDGALAAAGCLLTVAALSLAWHAWFGTRDATTRTVADLHSTQAQLTRARHDLADATAALAAAREVLGDDLVTRDARQVQRDAVTAQLSEARRVLTDARAQLDSANVDLVQRTSGLDALNTCLQGTSAALNQAAVGDVRGMVGSIGQVEAVCAAAEAAL